LTEDKPELRVINSSLDPTCEPFVPEASPLKLLKRIIEQEGTDLDSSEEMNENVELVQNNDSDEIIEELLEVNNDGYIYDEIEDITDEINVGLDKLKGYLTRLEPAELLTVPVKIGDNILKALIDTGASDSLMKECVVTKLGLSIDSSMPMKIKGLGSGMITTTGCVVTDVELLNKKIENMKFDVVQTKYHKFDIILGEKFLRENRLIINMKNRCISVINDDSSKSDFYVDKNGLKHAMHEQVPVYAGEEVVLHQEGRVINVNFAIKKYKLSEEDKRLVYFQSCVGKSEIIGMDGILDGNQEEKMVLLSPKIGSNKRQTKVKKGDLIGYVNTVLEVDSGDDKEEKWSVEELRNKINIGEGVSNEQKDIILEMLNQTQEVFGKGESEIGKALVKPHTIELTDNTPIWQRHRKFPDPVDDEIEKHCDQLRGYDIVRHSSSDWSAPIVPVRKKDGSLRICIDYRKLNNVTKQLRFPMPNVADSIYSAYGMKYFTKLDVVKGFYQVPLAEESKKYTAFSTARNHYEFNRISFGLKNSGVAFQQNMQQILTNFPSKNVIIYIDDILIMTHTFDEHLDLVRKVLTTLFVNGIKIKTAKCEFFCSSVTFLGHIIGIDGIKKAPEYIEKIRNYPKPVTTTELRQFLGLVNFQCKFIPNCSSIA